MNTLIAAITVALLWWARPLGLIHEPIMYLYTHPLVWFAPLVAFSVVLAIGLGIAYARKRRREAAEGKSEEDDRLHIRPRRGLYEAARNISVGRTYYGRRRERPIWAIPALAAFGVALVTSIAAMIASPILTGRAIYEHYSFGTADGLPEVGQVRVMPKQVAEQLASAGWNSPTEKLVDGHIIRTPEGNLAWSFEQAPSTFIRQWTQKAEGGATLDASITERKLATYTEDFKVSPSLKMWRKLTWKAYKTHFFTDVAEQVFIVGRDGEPLLVAPYIKYEGFPIRVPVLGGVYVLHPEGEMEDLSPEEAAKRPEIAESGRLFPESLARRIMDSYKYKNGIWNRLFIHKEQTEIADSEIADNEDGEVADNPQPYLMDFGEQGTKWVATAQPYGHAHATNGVFITDTITGETELWRTPQDSALTGNTRAVEIVRGLSIPGVSFDEYEAVEPRPLIIGGKLMFLVSVIPNSGNTVTKSVIVDAERNKAVAIFHHDTDPGADRALREYIHQGKLPEDAGLETTRQDPSTGEEAPVPEGEQPEQPEGSGEELSGSDVAELLRELEEIERREAELIRELRSRVEQHRK